MKELIELARDKGFVSRNISFLLTLTKSGNEQKIKYWFFLWMCEFQGWLREFKNIDVEVYLLPSYHNSIEIEQYDEDRSFTFRIRFKGIGQAVSMRHIYFKYEQSLEKGLIDALKLIK